MPTKGLDAKGATCNSGDPKPWIHSTAADLFFGCWIMLNALQLAFETELRNESNDNHLAWFIVDSTFNVIFIVEMTMRICADGRRWCSDAWNIFDAFLVSAGVLDSWILAFTASDINARMVTAFRVLRLMKLLRLLRVFQLCKELTLIIEGVASAMRAIVWGFALLSITIFLCSILITQLVGKNPDPLYTEYFGSMFRTAFTLLQFTFEFQPDVCRQTWENGILLTLFFILFSCFTNITMLNIISSIIVDSIVNISSGMEEEDDQTQADANLKELETLKVTFQNANSDADEQLYFAEFKEKNPPLLKTLQSAGLDKLGAKEFRALLDSNESMGISNETFSESLTRCHKPPQAKHLLQLECRVIEMGFKMNHLGDVLALIKQQVDPSVREASYQQEAAQISLEFQHNDRIDEVLSLLNQLVDFTKHGNSYQQEPAETSKDMHLDNRIDELLSLLIERLPQEKDAQISRELNPDVITEHIKKDLLPALQSELRAWCNHWEMQLKRNLTELQRQHMAQQGSNGSLASCIPPKESTHEIVGKWKMEYSS